VPRNGIEDGKFVLVANYMGGNATVFPVQPDGSLGAAVANVQHQGKGANAKRQEAPHAHNVVLDPANRFAFVSDLGIDKVMIYRFDAATGKLQPHATPAAGMKPGAGPPSLYVPPTGKIRVRHQRTKFYRNGLCLRRGSR
jgi:6-phosphogluconolactonase